MPFDNTFFPAMPDAQAVVRGNHLYPDLYGIVFFCQMPCGVFINAQFHGLPVLSAANANARRFLGFHIHEYGDCAQNADFDFDHAGNHYNPENFPHPGHRGDLPPILNCGGYAWQSFLTDTFTVAEIIGRSVIIHSQPDDFTTQPSGNSGVKIGCGVIQQNH
ncbi:MAG: superoxide dismutase family protein [Bacillus sp. (in: Bacteria)]|nr:superoxide dismutase family protein [Bacillus sp. (in: firmicutes)]MCM1427886.1 superoxide dismutase family protein [Eubacterium sp.]